MERLPFITVKMINGKPDEVDHKLMNALQANARIELSTLAALVCKTITPVHDRIRKLQEAGYIKGYIALVDRGLVGRPVLVVAHVRLDKQTTEQLDEFERTANAMDEVQFCLHVSGGWNFILHIHAATPQAYFDFLMKQVCSLPNVAHVESCIVLKECKSYGPIHLG